VRLSQGLDRACNDALHVKAKVAGVRAQTGSNVKRAVLIDVMRDLTQALVRWQQTAALPGIAQYARDQWNNQALDVAAEFTTMVNAATALRDDIFTTFPKQAGVWLVHSYDNAGVPTDAVFTPAQLGNFNTLADALIAAVG
jgi:hypothetical protein